MKKLITILTLMVVTSASYALELHGPGKSSNDNRIKATNDQGQVQNSNSTSTTQNAIDYSQSTNSRVDASDLSNAIGTGIAPNLTSGFNTCLGSASFGAGWSGFGFGVGKTYEDRPCNRRNDAMTMAKMGSVATAREVMCGDIDVLRASVRAGKPCWLQDENLLDELSDAERNYYDTLMAAPVAVVPTPNEMAIIEKRLDNMAADTDKKLDAIHNAAMLK